VLDHLTLSSPDPASPGHSVTILAVKQARLELAEIPRRGAPIRFSEVILDSPEIHALAATPGGASLVGFSNLVKDSADSRKPGAAAPAPLKLSDILLIRHVAIINGTASYDPRMPDTPPIWLDAINAGLDLTPAGTSSGPGLYTIATTISRKPAFDLAVQGQMDIDTLTLELAKLELTLDLQEKNAHFLPPELQKLLQTFEITGLLRVTAAGSLPLADWRQLALRSTGELTAARVAAGPHQLAVDAWNWDAQVGRGGVLIRQSDAHLLGGELHVAGTIPLGGADPARLQLNVGGIQIQQILRATHPGEVPQYAGNLDAAITFSAPPTRWNQQATGGGTISLRQGRIDNIPVLGNIFTDVGNLMKHPLGGGTHALTDTAEASFTFAGDGLRFDRFAGTAGALALRGGGTLGFDQRLDLRLNGGPMEGLQNSLGAVGAVWASMSDAMAGYRVGGTLEDPKVSMEIGGGR
jgi:hypothetical protein